MNAMSGELSVVKEALVHYRSMWAMWLELRMTTEAERELARMKIALIDRELLSMAEAEGQSRVAAAFGSLRPSGPAQPAFDPRQWHCKNEGCGEEIHQVTSSKDEEKYWVHVETGNPFCDVPPKNPAYGKQANPAGFA